MALTPCRTEQEIDAYLNPSSPLLSSTRVGEIRAHLAQCQTCHGVYRQLYEAQARAAALNTSTLWDSRS